MDFTLEELFTFIDEAGKATYVGNGVYVEPERQGFRELIYSKSDFSYRDSYAGFYRSRGSEVVRWKGKPVWSSLYGGGMVAGFEDMASQAFDFLKIAFRYDEKGFNSFRGPHHFVDHEWEYTYFQEGDITEFNGYEEIRNKGEVVFTHRIIGGLIRDKI